MTLLLLICSTFGIVGSVSYHLSPTYKSVIVTSFVVLSDAQLSFMVFPTHQKRLMLLFYIFESKALRIQSMCLLLLIKVRWLH